MKKLLPLVLALLLPFWAYAGDFPKICIDAEHLSWSGEENATRALALYDQCLQEPLTDEQKGPVYYNVGVLQQGLRMDAEAVASYGRAAELNPGDYMSYNNMAWILASSPDPDVVDGEKAEKYALKACSLSRNVGTLDTKAAALARAGKYGEAVKVQKAVITVAEELPTLPAAVLLEMKDRLNIYSQNKPYTESVKSTILK